MVLPAFRASGAQLSRFLTPFSFEIGPRARTAVYGPGKRQLLEIVAGKVRDPSRRISFPAFGRDLWPSQAIQFISFGQSTSASAQAPFVGARYESFRDEHDLSLRDVLTARARDASQVAGIANLLKLSDYLDNWFVGLSNGQSRRAQLAIALLRNPRLLVIDEPFLGLDPINREALGSILDSLDIPVVIGLRGGEASPEWVTQFLFAAESEVQTGDTALSSISGDAELTQELLSRKNAAIRSSVKGDPAVELKDITIIMKGATEPLFANLNLSVRHGERIHIQGPNGSGKSTLLALITADHPQGWNERVVLFGEPREVGKHSYFSIQKDIGHSSPEIHAIFPKHLSARRAISTGFSHSMLPPSELLPEQMAVIEAYAGRLGINLQDETPMQDMSLAQQKLVMFARALVKSPRILILDEAFSTLDKKQLRQAFDVLDEFPGAVLIVGHVEEEIPAVDQAIRLGTVQA